MVVFILDNGAKEKGVVMGSNSGKMASSMKENGLGVKYMDTAV